MAFSCFGLFVTAFFFVMFQHGQGLPSKISTVKNNGMGAGNPQDLVGHSSEGLKSRQKKSIATFYNINMMTGWPEMVPEDHKEESDGSEEDDKEFLFENIDIQESEESESSEEKEYGSGDSGSEENESEEEVTTRL